MDELNNVVETVEAIDDVVMPVVKETPKVRSVGKGKMAAIVAVSIVIGAAGMKLAEFVVGKIKERELDKAVERVNTNNEE